MTSPREKERTSYEPDISLCWDGATELAELRVDAVTLVGDPEDIRYVFDAINALWNRAKRAEWRVQDSRALLERALREFDAS